jgi:hypothetical protein
VDSMIINYNIHGLLGFRIIGNDAKTLRYIDTEYGLFRVSKLTNPDLTVIIGKFKPKVRGCFIINSKYHIRKNFFYCRDSYKVAKWIVQIEGLESKRTVVRFDGNIFSPFFLCLYIIEPLLRLKMAKRGFTFLHASGVSDGKTATIFAACKGVGKTLTMINLIRKGGIFLSDDFIILSRNGTVYSYPVAVHLFGHNLKQCPFLLSKLSVRDKMMIMLKNLIYILTRGYAQFQHSIKIQDIFASAKIGSSYPLKTLVFLIKTKKAKIEIKKIPLQKLIKQLMAVIKFNTFYFSDYLMAYTYLFQKGRAAKYWQDVRNNLKKALKGKQLVQIELPERYTSASFKRIEGFLCKSYQ